MKEVKTSEVRPILRLFKALPVIHLKRTKKLNDAILKETIRRGFLFSSDIVFDYSEEALRKLIPIIEKEVGLTPEKMNATFHKSWKKVKETPIEQLIFEQIIHYFTTYGFEALGIYDENSVYIPYEKLEIPELKENIKLTLIKGYTDEELKEKILKLLQSGIALKEETIKDIVEVIKYVGIDKKEIDNVKNKEVRITLYDLLDLFPQNPIEFLRYVIYKVTGDTLLIKNKTTIETIKSKLQNKDVRFQIEKLFNNYTRKYSLEGLSLLFYRFKPLFLAFRCNSTMKTKINKVRKLAVKHHKPMLEDYLNTITARIKNRKRIDLVLLRKELSRVNIFRKIRLAYALKFRTKENNDSIVYRIRNGKGYATDFSFNRVDKAREVLDIILKSIAKDIKKNVKGKKIYIPKEVIYTLPATEKQFTGYLPTGSYVEIPKDMIMGVHWENVEDKRTDLDLSIINESAKLGWDAGYRNESNTLLFSGDVTSAPLPNGATELFYVQKQVKDVHLLFVNNYTYNYGEISEVPFTIIVGQTQLKNIPNNYMLDPNNVVTTVKSTIGEKQKMLGMLVTTTKENRFYFVETYIGGSISSRKSEVTENSRKFLFNFFTNTISLNEVLLKARAKLVESKDQCEIDLSPENLEKDTIINLLT